MEAIGSNQDENPKYLIFLRLLPLQRLEYGVGKLPLVPCTSLQDRSEVFAIDYCQSKHNNKGGIIIIPIMTMF